LLQQEFGFRPLYHFLATGGLWASNGLSRFDQRVWNSGVNRVVQAILLSASTLLSRLDQRIFDAFASAAARVTLVVIRASGYFDVRALDAAFTRMGEDILVLSQRLRRWQTGRIENYLLVIIIWGVGILTLAVAVSIVVVR
jgi:hypothetical protein